MNTENLCRTDQPRKHSARIVKTFLAFCCFSFILLLSVSSCGQKNNQPTTVMKSEILSKEGLQFATFGSGCFWCTEAIFQNLEGVEKVVSGYTGGKVKNPTYQEICSGLTGHAEVTQISFDPEKISFKDLLEVFWQTHDPTTLNRQGADEGTQYRSAIFYHDDEQKKLAETYKESLNKSGAFDNPIVTEISSLEVFYKAEDYHQNYYNLNGNAPYCTYVIKPKLEKFKKAFGEKLK